MFYCFRKREARVIGGSSLIDVTAGGNRGETCDL